VARILYLTHVLPYPLDAGAKIRAHYVLRHLASQHQVTLVSFVRADDRSEYASCLERFCQAVHTVPMRRSRLRDARALIVAGLSDRPIIIVRDEIGRMHTVLKKLVKQESFDVVHADQTSMAQYALYARSRSLQKPKLLLDAHNALYRIPERLAAHERNPLKRLLLQREARALARYEAGAYGRFDHIVFVTDQDRRMLEEQIAHCKAQGTKGELRFTTIPICIGPEEKAFIELVPRPRAITHLGTMFWPPNIEGVLWFAQKVFPRVLAQVPDARFVIAGKNPPQKVRKLQVPSSGQLTVHNAQPETSVVITGYVADPATYLRQSAVFIVPLHAGGGMRVKILDAWCWGVPIVSTTIGAEGIAVRDGENILIADTVEAFAQAVVRVLQEPALGERLRRNGRRWVEERYNWRRAYSRWDKVYQRLSMA
jgi:glycosyltransferase involved in cell wall biosynthesis